MENINIDFEKIFSDADSTKDFLTQISYFFEAVIHYLKEFFELVQIKPGYAKEWQERE